MTNILKTPVVILLLYIFISGCASNQEIANSMNIEWETELLKDHPLVGKIWSHQSQSFVDPRAVIQQTIEQKYILLGEKHDNPDHHRIQAWLTGEIYKSGRKMALAFEMFSSDKSEILEQFQAAQNKDTKDASELGPLTNWENSGWPNWSHYQPIAQHALDNGAKILAANMTRDQAMSMARQNKSFLDDQARARMHLDRPFPDALIQVKSKELMRGHCNMLPEHMVEPMLLAQTTRDAIMADVMIEAATQIENGEENTDGTILISGAGHARSDWGVPWHILQRQPESAVLSIAMLEVHEDYQTVQDYSEEWDVAKTPFDFIWFTPRVDMDDPCEKYAKQLKAMGK